MCPPHTPCVASWAMRRLPPHYNKVEMESYRTSVPAAAAHTRFKRESNKSACASSMLLLRASTQFITAISDLHPEGSIYMYA